MSSSATALWPVSVDRAFDGETRLPVLSPVALRVIQLSDDPLCDARKVAETVSADAGLTARILKLANSSYYGYAGQMTSLPQAIVLLGNGTIRNVVLGLSMSDLCKSTGSTPYVDGFWENSFLAGCLALSAAKLIGHAHHAHAFTAGLLHDVGKLIIQHSCVDVANMIAGQLTDESTSVVDVEERLLGFNHAHVGGWAAARWKFPPTLIEAIGLHESPQSATLDPELCASVALAAHYAASASEVTPDDGWPRPRPFEGELFDKLWQTWVPQRAEQLNTLEFMRGT